MGPRPRGARTLGPRESDQEHTGDCGQPSVAGGAHISGLTILSALRIGDGATHQALRTVLGLSGLPWVPRARSRSNSTAAKETSVAAMDDRRGDAHDEQIVGTTAQHGTLRLPLDSTQAWARRLVGEGDNPVLALVIEDEPFGP